MYNGLLSAPFEFVLTQSFAVLTKAAGQGLLQRQYNQMFNAGGKIDDTNDVKIGMTNASLFAYLADGHNGLQVVQLFSPESNPNHYGFSPRPV